MPCRLFQLKIAYVTFLVGHIIGNVAHLGDAIVHGRVIVVEQVVGVIDVIRGIQRWTAAGRRW